MLDLGRDPQQGPIVKSRKRSPCYAAFRGQGGSKPRSVGLAEHGWIPRRQILTPSQTDETDETDERASGSMKRAYGLWFDGAGRAG